MSRSAVQRFDGDVEFCQCDFSNCVSLEGRIGMRAAVDAGISCILVVEEA